MTTRDCLPVPRPTPTADFSRLSLRTYGFTLHVVLSDYSSLESRHCYTVYPARLRPHICLKPYVGSSVTTHLYAHTCRPCCRRSLPYSCTRYGSTSFVKPYSLSKLAALNMACIVLPLHRACLTSSFCLYTRGQFAHRSWLSHCGLIEVRSSLRSARTPHAR